MSTPPPSDKRAASPMPFLPRLPGQDDLDDPLPIRPPRPMQIAPPKLSPAPKPRRSRRTLLTPRPVATRKPKRAKLDFTTLEDQHFPRDPTAELPLQVMQMPNSYSPPERAPDAPPPRRTPKPRAPVSDGTTPIQPTPRHEPPVSADRVERFSTPVEITDEAPLPEPPEASQASVDQAEPDEFTFPQDRAAPAYAHVEPPPTNRWTPVLLGLMVVGFVFILVAVVLWALGSPPTTGLSSGHGPNHDAADAHAPPHDSTPATTVVEPGTRHADPQVLDADDAPPSPSNLSAPAITTDDAPHDSAPIPSPAVTPAAVTPVAPTPVALPDGQPARTVPKPQSNRTGEPAANRTSTPPVVAEPAPSKPPVVTTPNKPPAPTEPVVQPPPDDNPWGPVGE